MSFPTLSKKPTTIETSMPSNTIKTEFDGGYIQARERNTRDRKVFNISYSILNKADITLLNAHYASVRGSGIFSWTNPSTTTTHQVRYQEPFRITADAHMPDDYPVTMILEEV